ncbi:MAG: hypothetical protein Q7U56_03655 [Humidesulfovibrio sp.]|nr:hypothetical protein [Humidesulfovibrio sp.]
MCKHLKIIEAIMKRGDPAYRASCGALFDLLRGFALQQDLESFAEACQQYAAAHPDASGFIARHIPGILVNNYFTVRQDIDYNKFIAWSLSDKGWAESLSKKYDSPQGLTQAVESICSHIKV